MLSIELRRAIIEFRKESESYQAFLDLVRTLAAYHEKTEVYVRSIADTQAAHNAILTVQNRYAGLPTVTADIGPRQVYKALEAFTAGIKRHLDNSDKSGHLFAKRIAQDVERFGTLYDAFLMVPNRANSANLSYEASYLHVQLEMLLETFNFFESTIDSDEPNGDESELFLLLFGTSSFKDFVKKLQALQDLYVEICMLAGVSGTEHPLRIGKIESGSLFAKVWGDPKVMPFIAALIESTIGFLHRKFTIEGKIASVPRSIEALNSAVNLSENLAKLGINTAEMDEHLRKSGVIIGKTLSTLLQDQARVQVNDQTFSLGDKTEPYLLEQRKHQQLESEAN